MNSVISHTGNFKHQNIIIPEEIHHLLLNESNRTKSTVPWQSNVSSNSSIFTNEMNASTSSKHLKK